ncbi:helix-turn-helix domain-containing protein [Kitasatospora aureofaciens]|uniref:winged helix-turn-helix transcriptional regulator n=1 Tax=Kitasatospora aureofaciens TaxID=1894 RepID=UPI001C44D204|nr:helix-turn-helix domain-containing protein [Kitasatospora aureofaciens]MBV6698798.1 helix-turn-helix transcriptional regulator [Kitasatospora aureofaciens]
MSEHEVVTDRVPTASEACAGDQGTCFNVELALTRVFSLLGKRWTGLLVGVLNHGGPAYFSELRRAVPGISERMLSDRLTELADAGLVLREVDAGPPLRVSYRLTDAGAALRPALNELAVWADQYLPESALKQGGC